MRIACVGYRDWALNIYDSLSLNNHHQFLILRSKDEYDETTIREFQPDYILFYGWSWIISGELLNDFPCIMLHPSPLPKYRGGSPIQNQIANGEKTSAVTLFIMNNKLDEGDIIAQQEFSLSGSLKDIFTRITAIGIELTEHFLSKGTTATKQDHSQSTYFKRRKPIDSDISALSTLGKVHDYIRMLDDEGYPKAFIETSNLRFEFSASSIENGHIKAQVSITLK